MGIKDLIRQGNVQGVAAYLAQNPISAQELSELRNFAEGAGRTEVLSSLDSALASNGRKDSGSSGNASSLSSNIPGVNYDIEKAYEYLEKLEEEYRSDKHQEIYENQVICQSVDILMSKIIDASKFSEGFRDAVQTYHNNPDIKHNDYKYFILVELIQEFYERFTPDKYYTEELRDRNFADLVECVADEVNGFYELLGINPNSLDSGM